MEKRSVCIVGGGASGLTAAVMAARAGAQVTLLERKMQPDKCKAGTFLLSQCLPGQGLGNPPGIFPFRYPAFFFGNRRVYQK